MGARKLCIKGDGRKVYRADLCQACYRARPRTLARKGEGGAVTVVRLTAELLQAMEAAAAAEGVTLSDWRRRAYVERLRAQGRPVDVER